MLMEKDGDDDVMLQIKMYVVMMAIFSMKFFRPQNFFFLHYIHRAVPKIVSIFNTKEENT